MHDSRLEDRLRSVLRTEGDGLPLTITSAELERRLLLRRRRATSRWVSLVAAAVAVVAVGAVIAFGDGWFGPVVGTQPSASSSSGAIETPFETFPSPVVVPGLGRIAPTPGAEVVFEVEPTLSDGGASGTVRREFDSMTYAITIRVACLGVDQMEISVNGRTEFVGCQPAVPGRNAADNPQVFVFPIVNQAFLATYTVPDKLAFTILAEDLPTSDRLPALDAPMGTVAVDAASDSDRPIPGYPGDTVEKTVGQLPESDTQRFALVCLGPGTVTVAIGPPGQPDPATTNDVICDGEPNYNIWSLGTPGPLEMTITADPRIAWRVIATTEGPMPSVAP